MYKAKKEGKNKPLAASYHEGFSDDEIRELCHSKDHDCATVVEHPVWGKGKPVHGSHAIPTDDGYVEWYDVQFKHGIEEKVMAEDMRIMVSEAHHEEKKKPKTKNGMITAMKNMMLDMEKVMNKMKLAAAYDVMAGMHEKMHEGGHLPGEKNEAVEKRVKNINVKEHVDALVEGEVTFQKNLRQKLQQYLKLQSSLKFVTKLKD